MSIVRWRSTFVTVWSSTYQHANLFTYLRLVYLQYVSNSSTVHCIYISLHIFLFIVYLHFFSAYKEWSTCFFLSLAQWSINIFPIYFTVVYVLLYLLHVVNIYSTVTHLFFHFLHSGQHNIFSIYSTVVYINHEGCVNTLQGECTGFYQIHGKVHVIINANN